MAQACKLHKGDPARSVKRTISSLEDCIFMIENIVAGALCMKKTSMSSRIEIRVSSAPTLNFDEHLHFTKTNRSSNAFLAVLYRRWWQSGRQILMQSSGPKDILQSNASYSFIQNTNSFVGSAQHRYKLQNCNECCLVGLLIPKCSFSSKDQIQQWCCLFFNYRQRQGGLAALAFFCCFLKFVEATCWKPAGTARELEDSSCLTDSWQSIVVHHILKYHSWSYRRSMHKICKCMVWKHRNSGSQLQVSAGITVIISDQEICFPENLGRAFVREASYLSCLPSESFLPLRYCR